MNDIIARAREVIDIEIEGLRVLRDGLDGGFEELVNRCVDVLNRGGKIVIAGIGKSGYIGKKISATLSSVGSPAVFMHPVEALHGDLGMMQENDILLAISYSGETEELLEILTPARRLGIPVVAITGDSGSRLARLSDFCLEMKVSPEACPFNLAPTTSTTALLALGDALALVLLKVRGFTREDYGRLHPGGAIGRSVTLQVGDIMRGADRFAVVEPETRVKDALFRMTNSRCGSAIVIDAERRPIGIFTDGDFRRHVEKDLSILERKMAEVMTCNPFLIRKDQLAIDVIKGVEKRKINDVIVVDENGRVCGLVDVQDLPSFKLI